MNKLKKILSRVIHVSKLTNVSNKKIRIFSKDPALEIKKDAEKKLKRGVYLIPFSEDVYHSQVRGIPVSHYKPNSKVSLAYKKITDSLVGNIELKEKIDDMLKEQNGNN